MRMCSRGLARAAVSATLGVTLGVAFGGAFVVTLPGCGGKDTNHMKYAPGGSPNLGKADATGFYELYSTEDKKNPIVTYRVQRGERLGFMRDETGQTVAVAGENWEIPLKTENGRNYFWKQREE